jgi:1-aminocyclopropane-1-carboxylate deaminase/D-cysteine desulfhydrase-like pyridoxal-dependent ACC family enzyme
LTYQTIDADVRPALPGLITYLVQYRFKRRRFPKLLEASSPVGIIGYVKAGFELQKQVELGILPEPDLVYVPLATLGTAVGLMLGLKAAGLQSRIVAVDLGGKMLGRKIGTFANVTKHFRETNELLRSYDPSFPDLTISETEFQIRPGYERIKDSLITPAGVQATRLLMETENLQLDEMFTANAFAALIEDGRTGYLHDKVALWWNSYNSRDLSPLISSGNDRQLPKYFQRYFVD